MQGTGNREQGTATAAPVRGTQSFVGVMVEVVKRPSLMAMEIAWRLLVWVPMLGILALLLHGLGIAIQFHPEVLSSLTVFKPVEMIAGLSSFFDGLAPLAGKPVLWWVGGLFALWILGWTVGRGVVMRRMEPGLVWRPGTLLALGVLRVASIVAVMLAWFAGCKWVIAAMVLRPAVARQEPNLVGAFALVVSGTLVLFVLWCTVSWVLQLAPIVAMVKNEGAEESLRSVVTAGSVRGKLIEINLVMGIVKVILIVLAMVFSACPLPFETVETRAFLIWWTVGVGVVWVVASDYFHVVRAAVYLRLWERGRQ